MAWRTFQYHLEAFDYIVKEPEQIGPSVSQCLEEIHTHLLAERQAPEEMFTLRVDETVRHIPLRDILFFESAAVPHHFVLHTSNSRMDFLGSLNELEVKLGDRFVRTHRAYLVAADKIKEVDWKHHKLWLGGRECLISRGGKAELRKKMGGNL